MAQFDTTREDSHKGPQVTWDVNRKCNFRCAYCFYGHDELAKEYPGVGVRSPERITNCFDQTGDDWWIFMTGGEPFLYPNFIELCQRLTKKHHITINTNCSTNNVVEFANTINPERVYSINASLHIEQREKMKGGLDRFIERALLFQEKGFQFRAEYVLHPTLFPRLEEDIAMLTERGVEIVNIKSFQGIYNGQRYPLAYSDEQVAIMKKYAYDPVEIGFTEKPNSFKGLMCDAGKRYLRIEPDGTAYRCTSSAVALGNFFENPQLLDSEPRACVFKRCGCSTEGVRMAHKSGKAPMGEYLKEYIKETPAFLADRYSYKRIMRFLRLRARGNK